jgi:broad specificity phosphatase PhoE
VERPLGLNDAWNNVLGENAAQAEAQRRGGKQLLLSRIATCPVYPDAARSGGHAPASASASCAATETPERLALQRLRNPPAERSKSSPAGPLGDYTLNRPAKTPTVMRVRRGSSYKIRRMRMSADPEELASMPAELAAAEEMVHQDVDPMEEREEMVHQDVHPTAAGSARAWEPASPPRVGPTPSVAATTAATPACPMTEMTLMNSMHDCLGMSTPPIGVRRPPRAPSSLMQLDASMRTPELHSTPAVGARPGAPPGAASFTLMRAACTGTAKSVHLVRHGESEYNRQLSFNKSWEDPQVFDPPLTRKGVEQCLELKERLRRLPNLQTAMWVCSPLSRAIETLLYSCPLDVEQLVARGQLVIKWEVTEFLQTTGDIGLPASCLRRKYPILAPAMDQLPEVWWYGNLESNNPFKRQCRAFEPKVAEAKRIAQFRGFLEESTERTVVAVGHSLFFKHFAGNGDSLSNCGILTMSI